MDNNNQIARVQPPQNEPISVVNTGGIVFRPKTIKVGGEIFVLDAMQMMRMIRNLTQQIGEYRGMGNVYSKYVIPSLRKCRSDIANDLSQHFKINFKIDPLSGRTIFYV